MFTNRKTAGEMRPRHLHRRRKIEAEPYGDRVVPEVSKEITRPQLGSGKIFVRKVEQP